MLNSFRDHLYQLQHHRPLRRHLHLPMPPVYSRPWQDTRKLSQHPSRHSMLNQRRPSTPSRLTISLRLSQLCSADLVHQVKHFRPSKHNRLWFLRWLIKQMGSHQHSRL